MPTFYFRCFLLIVLGTSLQACPKVQTAVLTQEIFLVRHAEKAKDGTHNPPLDAQGQQRAQNLAKVLSDKNIAAVFVTPYLRTQLTGQPVADLFQLTLIEYDPHDPSIIQKWLAEHPDKNILIVGHSNTTPKMVNMLLKQEVLSQLEEDDYGKLFCVIGVEDNRQLITETF